MNNASANDNMSRQNPDGPAAMGAVLGGIWNSAIYGPDQGVDPRASN